MKQVARGLVFAGSIYLGCLAGSIPARAQIIPDGTLPSGVSQEGNVLQITGGAQAGSNLFHSFQQFSLPRGNTAFFNNASNIANIISRVTGGSISTIDGLIRANGNANLILINPSGINFGPNAQLNIGGSFLASTASSLVFEDGTVFSATNPQAPPLLTVSVPAGLQMGQNPGAIRVQGAGHNLTVADPIFSPITRGNNLTGLSVRAGHTLALVGGNINLEGGILTAEGGRIELGSVTEGLVNIESLPQGWKLGYAQASNFQDVELRSRSLADASGLSGGSIQVRGQNLSVGSGSLLLIQNQGPQPAGNISVSAAGAVEVSGTDAGGTVRSSLTNETVGSGPGGDVEVATRRLVVQEGATIVAKTVRPGTGKGGSVNLNASESVQVTGASALNPSVTSSIVAATFGSGDGGNNTVSTGRLSAIGGGTIATATFGSGRGGDLSVSATDAIDITGIEPTLLAPSALLASTFNTGNAGNLTVNTPQLTVRDGARVDASTFATGVAGSVTINAPKFVEVKGTAAASINPSLVSSSANLVDETLQRTFGLPPVPSGASGDVTINTGQLSVTDGAQVTVRNDGSGDAGTLRVDAGSIFLGNLGGISAVTRGGRGGNINLQVRDSLQMGGFSQISSDNFGAGDSGDLTVETGKLSIRDGAFISATTFAEGKGSNIAIRASDSLEITGTGFEEFQRTFQAGVLSGTVQPDVRGTGIFLGTSGNGASGNLTVTTSSLLMQDGAIIFSPTFTGGIGGNISILASESVELSGSAVQSGTSPGSTGTAGNIEVDTGKLVVREGATIINATFGDGAGGDVEVSASESVELRNTPAGALLLTGIYANTTLGSGAGGDIRVDTAKLSIRDGVISSNTGASLPTGIIPLGGPGGNVTVNATESMEIAGILADTRFASGLGTTSFSPSPSGDLTISTKKLTVSEGADISTSALGGGQGGSLTINASESIELIGTTVGDLTLGGLSAASGRANLPELEASGASGDIRVTTKDLVVRDGASIDVQSLGSGDAGNLEVVADSIFLDNQGTISASSRGISNTGNLSITARSIVLDNEASIVSESGGGISDILNQVSTGADVGGPPPDAQIPGALSPQTRGQTKGGDINISTQQLVIRGGAEISTATFTATTGGNLTVDAPESVQVIGVSPANPGLPSLIGASTFGPGDSGDVTVSTGRLAILDGGRMGAGTLGTGKGGNLTVKATESVEVIGVQPNTLTPSGVAVTTFNAGEAGSVTINTASLTVGDGGFVSASTLGSGSAGNVTINASESVEVSGTVPGTLNPSLVSAGANVEDAIAQQILGRTPLSSGASGDVRINTGQLRVTDGAQVTARNEGSGNAGNLGVSADSIFLNNEGSITAATQSGEGGNINLQSNSLLMRHNSQISATAGGTGNGGNITLTGSSPADFVLLLEGSEISANAFQGRGGNIQIETRGLFVCGDCQITATSAVGVDGLVTINRLQPNTELQVIDVPQEVAESEEVVALACSTADGEDRSEFIITGRGGLPPRPSEPLSSEALVSFDSSPARAGNQPAAEIPPGGPSAAQLPAPARGWYINPEGVTILTAQAPSPLPYSSGLTTSKCHGN